MFSIVRRLLLAIARLSLLFSAVGICGVVANLASERTQKVGMRMALGAPPCDVRWLFLSRAHADDPVVAKRCTFGVTDGMNIKPSLTGAYPARQMCSQGQWR
jgi:hypothetical protein